MPSGGRKVSESVFERILLIEEDSPRTAGLQMAVDQVLLQTATLPVLRAYRWDAPCVTIGYFESYATARRAHPSLPVVRRWTGGGSVLHGKDAPYTLIVPRRESFAELRPCDTYRLIHGLLARALGQNHLGITLSEAGAPKRNSNCFDNPVTADLLRAGRKIGGAGQRRTRFGLLHQGSIQVGTSSFEEARIFANLLASEVQDTSLSETTLHLARELAASRYEHSDWNADREGHDKGPPTETITPPWKAPREAGEPRAAIP